MIALSCAFLAVRRSDSSLVYRLAYNGDVAIVCETSSGSIQRPQENLVSRHARKKRRSGVCYPCLMTIPVVRRQWVPTLSACRDQIPVFFLAGRDGHPK